MSRWTLESWCGHWLLWAEPDRLRVLRAGPLNTRASFVEHASVPREAGDEALLRACVQACAAIRTKLPVTVTLALQQESTPALEVELPVDRMPWPVRKAYLEERFHQVYGEAADGWLIRCDARVRTGRAIAFACRQVLAASLARLSCGTARLHVIPGVAWGAAHALRASGCSTGWYVHAEADRHVALWVERNRATHLALLPPVDGSDALRQRLRPWSQRFALTQEASTLMLGIADHRAPITAEDSHGPVVTVGLFEHHGRKTVVANDHAREKAWA